MNLQLPIWWYFQVSWSFLQASADDLDQLSYRNL